MTALRRAESERRGSVPSARTRPSSLYNNAEEHRRRSVANGLPHAQSVDGLKEICSDQPAGVKLSLYRESPLSKSLFENLGHHQRSMSHRELSHVPDGIVDAFGFAATGGYSSAYHSNANLNRNRPPQRMDFQYRKPPEVPPSPSNYQPQPAPPLRNESRGYQNSWSSMKQSSPSTGQSSRAPSIRDTIDTGMYNGVRPGPSRDTSFSHQQRGIPAFSNKDQQSNLTSNNREQQKQLPSNPVISNKSSYGAVVRRAESMKRIMQKNRSADHGSNQLSSGQPKQDTAAGSEVVTEKGRSVKSIVGMFDQQPAIHAALAKNRVIQANQSLAQESEQAAAIADVQQNGVASQKEAAHQPGRPERNSTQVVHIAKFVQIDSPGGKQAVDYIDAQTSPMQLSPAEQMGQPLRPSGAIVAKAETFNGGPRPKVATMTSSTSSSYLSNDVFTPCTDSIDSPVFEADLAYHRTDSSGRTHYSDSAASVSDGYDIAHNSHIPNSHNQRYAQQHIHLNNQLLRQELTDTESSNHYEDLESLRTASVHEMENIYEPISPMRREFATGNYMNFPTSPSSDYMDMNSPCKPPAQGAASSDRRSLDSDHLRSSSLSMESPRQHASLSNGDADYNEGHDEESYSNQVREASHRTLRQTSVEGNKHKSPTSSHNDEPQMNRYSLSKGNVNPVQPTTRTSAAIRPQVLSPYNSEMNLVNPDQVKMRTKTPHRTDSCRVTPRTKHVDRTSSYREPRGSSVDLRPADDQKAAIRDNLIDFYKRKSRDCSMDSTLDSNAMFSTSSPSGTPGMVQSPNHPSPNRPPPLHMAMHRIQSERSFNTRNIANPRASSLDRAPSVSASHGKSVDMEDSRKVEPQAYMQSWEATSAVASRLSGSVSDTSPTSPHTQSSESPRVRKPLVAEVSPFGMPGPKMRKERPSRQEMTGSSSSVGSGSLKPLKANVPHVDSSHDTAPPTLPPRNYHPEDVIANHSSHSDHKPASNSDHDLTKPYQNVFNGANKSDDFDAGYTEQLRRVSKHQYPTARPSGGQPTHHSPQANTNQQSPHGSGPSNIQSPHNSLPNSIQSPHMLSSHSAVPNSMLSPHNNGPSSIASPHNSTPSGVLSSHDTNSRNTNVHHQRGGLGSRSNSADTYLVKTNHPRLPLPLSNNELPLNSGQQVLETDIDSPVSPEAQPLPPPRRQTRDSDYSKPPPKPPKMFSTTYTQEINHNDPVPTQLPGQREPSNHIKPFSERIEQNDSVLHESPTSYHRNPMELPRRIVEGTRSPQTVSPAPLPHARKERGRSESMQSPKGQDMTVTSGDPTTHLNRRHSIGKSIKSRRSMSTSGDIGKDDRPSAELNKYSPTQRQRETEFSAIERPSHATTERLDPRVLSNAIHENRPRPFDRYQPACTGSTSDLTVSHSRQGSAELLDIATRAEAAPRHRERASPTPPPRSPKLSPKASRSARASTNSLYDSRKSTPSPHSSSSDVVKLAKSDPSTPVDESFVPISKKILADLADQGIDITEKHKCISDENKARLVKMTSLSTPSPTVGKKASHIHHIRQKSTDEILCDTQVENLGRSIKDETLSLVLSKPERGTTDYLPGLFDDVLTKDIPRKQRQSVDSSPCHSKQNSEGDSLSSKTGSTTEYEPPFDSELNTVQDKKGELILVLKKKLSVLRDDERFRQQEIEDNDDIGAKLVELVESKCNDREVRKYKSYIDEVEKITRLLLKLSRRLAKAENELRNAPMDATDDDKKSLEQRRNNLQRQHNDAKALKESIDKRKGQVVAFLSKSLDDAEFEQYDHYISIKLKLIMETSDIEDQILHCEEQIAAVTAISS